MQNIADRLSVIVAPIVAENARRVAEGTYSITSTSHNKERCYEEYFRYDATFVAPYLIN